MKTRIKKIALTLAAVLGSSAALASPILPTFTYEGLVTSSADSTIAIGSLVEGLVTIDYAADPSDGGGPAGAANYYFETRSGPYSGAASALAPNVIGITDTVAGKTYDFQTPNPLDTSTFGSISGSSGWLEGVFLNYANTGPTGSEFWLVPPGGSTTFDSNGLPTGVLASHGSNGKLITSAGETDFSITSVTTSITEVPEPATFGLLALATAAIARLRRRKSAVADAGLTVATAA